ncbi:MarR family winged helix-turn-helix transcriptional regulator [Shewanella sp. AS16]|uniref:MarR family winged helix-turn-helix transcriptional regulator n=1 Tax=Shewanella sp. AS16 TaxID=2907625 RepID=UPI001F2CE84C|nr:MarR family winged helix-turn-helix transcriptional regulator [Shewanella sp. AS16]MCE9685622.1 MarR family winged helix-turn-helix transcriptional regulator [Shewanella sp. AS16]
MTPTFLDYVERLNSLLRSWQRDDAQVSTVPAVQLSALRYLSICNHYSDTVTGVTEYLGLTKGTVSQSLKALEERQWLVKRLDPKDKRIVHLRPTQTGLALIQRLATLQVLENALAQLGAEAEQQLTVLLHELLTQMQQQESRKSFGICSSCRFHQHRDGRPFCGLTREPLPDDAIGLICREHQAPA